MTGRLLTVHIRQEHDIVAARQRARQIAAALTFDQTDQTRIATAVSELARNAYEYARDGSVEFAIEGSTAPQLLSVRVSDQGPGIANLGDVLEGRYRSTTGMGLGLAGTRRLMDRFDIQSSAGGTTVTIKKLMPPRSRVLSTTDLAGIAERLAAERPAGPIDELQRQNQELLVTLEQLRARQEELQRVNGELEDTNRGVVALYAELDERADHLRRADELKTKFLSNMTHEFRTPVNSILALTNLLAERLGSGPDQKDEVFYIRKSAQQLSDIVDDLLDIAKVEAGKIEVHPAPFEVPALFGALRGMLRPLLLNQSLALVFEEPEDIPPIFSDESKVSQILRNFISNALKYTDRGEVRVRASLTPARDAVVFDVSDTGIGIPADDLPRVFEEFVQIANPLQRRTKGTGLGLPLAKRLAELLGGSIRVVSELGIGSTFSVTIPLVYRDPVGQDLQVATAPGRVPVLVIEDTDEDLLLFERALTGTRYAVVPARTMASAAAALEVIRPGAIALDIRLHGRDSWDLLARLKGDAKTRAIPLIVTSSIDDRAKGFALGADAYAVKPIDRSWLLETLNTLVGRTSLRVLSVDDEEAFRFIISEMLGSSEFEVSAVASGRDALRAARDFNPDLILLDLSLDDMTGFEVCDRLRADPGTANIPVLVVTSRRVSEDDRRRLGGDQPVLAKAHLTREMLRSAIRSAAAGRAERR